MVSQDVAAKAAMPNRYSSARLYIQAALKYNLVKSAYAAGKAYWKAHPNNANPEWEQIYEYWPTGRYTLPNRAEALQLIPGRLELCVDEEAVSESSSSSSSDDSERAVRDWRGKELIPELASLERALSKTAKGRLHLKCVDGLCCGRNLHGAEHDSGIANAASTLRKWSPRCYARLPKVAKTCWDLNASETDNS